MSIELHLRHVWGQSQQLFSRSRNPAVHRAEHTRTLTRFLPPPLLLLLSALSVQLGAAFAKSLFQPLGPAGTVFLRVGFAALVLALFWRPRLRGYTRNDYFLVVLFGLAIAGLNTFFYAAISRIPLGIAVTLEFVGPLGVALAASRRLPHLLWAVLAVAGIILLAPIGGAAIDPPGVGLALLGGACWAAYILLNVRVGRAFPGGSGLALGMCVATLVLAPFGIIHVGSIVHDPFILPIGFGVAILSSVIPFSLELEALRRISARAFGILMSLDPAVAALIGLVVLGETVSLRSLIAMTLIIVASCGVSFVRKQDNS